MIVTRIGILGIALLVATPGYATGLATCDSGDKSTWQAASVLEKQLTKDGWTVRRIKEDGGWRSTRSTRPAPVSKPISIRSRWSAYRSKITTERHAGPGSR